MVKDHETALAEERGHPRDEDVPEDELPEEELPEDEVPEDELADEGATT